MSDELKELPEGWQWVKLFEIAAIKGGLTKGKKRKPTDSLRQIPYLRVANVQRGFLNLEEVLLIEATKNDIEELRLIPGDILFNEGGDRDKLGRGWIWMGELPECIHQNHVFRARPYLSDIQPQYISWYGNTFGQKYFLEEGKQTTNLASINLTKLSNLPLPLPPLNEQKRIVAQIEALRDRTHKAKAALDAIPELCDRFRQSVLASAFRGDLTADWREQNPDVEPASVLLERIRSDRRRRWEQEELGKFEKKGKKIVGDQWKLKYIEPASIDSDYQNIDVPEFWEVASVEQVTHRLTYGITVRPKYVDRGIPLISAREIRSGEVNIDLASQISVEDFNNLRDKCKLLENDILFSKTGTIGHVARVKTSELLCVSQNVALLSPLINPKYLEIILRSPAVQSLAKQSVKTTAIPDLQLGILSQFPIPLPPSTEQEQVVIEVHRLFLLIDTVEEQAINMASLKQVLDQSILAKAFQGELVEQDPNDEPASVLLDRIRAEREAQQPKKTKAKGRKKAE